MDPPVQQAQLAAVLGPDPAPFEALIAHLMSPSNDLRSQSELLYNLAKQTDPSSLSLKLASLLHSSPLPDLRSLSAVLLRKLLSPSSPSVFPLLSPSSQSELKSLLLSSLLNESSPSILKKLADTVSELASGILPDNNWPELLPFIFHSVSPSSPPKLQESAFLIFSQLSQYVGELLVPFIKDLHAVFLDCLTNSTSPDVRIAALSAAINFIQCLPSSAERDRFQDLLPAMMRTLNEALNSGQEATAQDALELLIELAGAEPRFLRRQIGDVMGCMLQIAEAEGLEEGTRNLAIEFVITLAEARERAPGMMRKLPQFVRRLFGVLMRMLLDVEDDPVWHGAETEDEDAGESSNYGVAQECLDRLAIALGGNTIVPVASELLPAYLAAPEWQKHHAALIALAQIAEGCSKVMIKNLEQVVSMVLNSFQDPHPRVRWAAINAIGQLSTDLGPDLQLQYHQLVLPALAGAMDDFPNPRVQAHAASAVLNFSENCTPEILTPYMDGIVSKLLVLLQNGKQMVQEGALTALASVADSSQEHFQKYYDAVMPYLKTILINATDKSNRMLRAKAMECISLVGMAVGKDKFRDDAKQQSTVPKLDSRAVEEPNFDNPRKSRTTPTELQMNRNPGPAQATKSNPPPVVKSRVGGHFQKFDESVPRQDNATLKTNDTHQRYGACGAGMNSADSHARPHATRSAGPSSSDSLQGVSGRPQTRATRPTSNQPMVGGPTVPEFGAWNKNPEQEEGYTDVFNQVLTDKKTPGRNPTTPHNPLRTAKKTKQFEVPKSGRKWQFFNNPRQAMAIPNESPGSHDAGPSQTTKPSPPPDAKTWEDGESKTADRGCTMKSADSHAKSYAVKSAGAVEQSLNQPRTEARGSVSQTSFFDRSTTRPARNLGTGAIGYKPIDKLKQRVADIMSYKKNIGELQAKIQLLMEEVVGAQSLLIRGVNDTKDKVQYWLEEADEILKEANSIVEDRNSMADKKRLCGTCWDPTSLWETGEMLRVINKILKERKGLNSLSYFCEFPYCKELQSRENKLEEILKSLMDIQINMIGIHGMVGVGKTVLAKELAIRVRHNQLFDAIVMVQVSEPINVKLIQAQIANEIGLQLSETDDEETRAHFLFNALEEKIIERGKQNGTESIQQGKILVILDGIQCVIDLVKVGIRHGKGARASCKAVLIARNIDVCKEMGVEKEFLVECLSLDESRILFQDRLGDKVEGTEITHERHQYMESVLLIRCGGLPLVIKSLACVLKCMSWSNWEIIVDQMERHTLIEVDEVKEVLHAILELCNNFIENGEKKKLFLLCCLIQKGMEFTLERLKRYGMGFGLFEDYSSAINAHQVNSWVSELKSLSLLSESKEPQHFKMHDIVQDVAISVLTQGDLPALLDAGTCWHTRETYENCIAISMMPESNYKCLNGLKLHKLQVYLLKGTPSLSLPSNYFHGMENLKILDISRTTFVDFPPSIGNLKNLVTLHLEYCDIQCRVISTISNLSKLEVLSLRGSSIEAVTEEIGNLSNLRLLDLTRCKNLRTFCVDAVAKLDQLRGLYLYDIWLDWSTEDMKKLKFLHLEELEIIIPKACKISVNPLNLRSFMISCIDSFSDTPHKDVSSFSRVLLISGDVALQPQESGLRDLLPSTEFLVIDKVNGLPSGVGDLNRHGFLHLKDLHLRMCGGMKCILDTSKLSSIQGDMFPELEILTLTLLYGLTSICRWLPPHSFFPKLRELRLSGLSRLHPYVLPIQLAVKLRVLEVSNCRSLLYIFPVSETNVTDGADSGLDLPCMEKLMLKELTSLLALQDVLEASTTGDELHRPHDILFNVQIPFLKEMHLEGLHHIGSLWDFSGFKECDVEFLQFQSQTWVTGPYRKGACFGNLKCMIVVGCNKLVSLFPSAVINSLLQLEKLHVHGCANMKEIITSTDVEDDTIPDTKITFPKLQILILSELQRLECFYQGRLPLKFPELRDMHIFKLWEIKAFTLPRTPSVQMEDTTLFDGECVFPSLQQLTVCWMNFELLERRSETTIFPNLSRLTMKYLPSLIALPNINSKSLRFLDLQQIECLKVLFSIQPTYMPSMPLIMSWELEELILREFDSLEELVDDDNLVDNGDQFDVKMLFSSRKLELRSLRQLKRIPWNMLANLRSLIIYRLEGWTSLISTTLLRGGDMLPVLEYLEVGDCDSLEAVISKEVQEEEDFVKYGMTLFPFLSHIDLYLLPLLQSFSFGSYEAHLPSLETVRISKCPLMHSFSLGPLITPRLKSLILDSRPIQVDTPYGLNAKVANLH